MKFLYHITTAVQAAAGHRAGSYTPTQFVNDGFIHCSYAQQVAGVANRLFQGKTDLVLLKIDQSRLTARIVDENLEGGIELFPHIYGPLEWSGVVTVIPFLPDPNGIFHAPADD